MNAPRLAMISLLAACLAGLADDPPPESLRLIFAPPEGLPDKPAAGSLLVFDDGRPVKTPEDWRHRREEILTTWHNAMGAWPPRVDPPEITVLDAVHRENYQQKRVHLKVAPDREVDGYLLVPDGTGPFPAMLVVFYEPETAIGGGKPTHDFARQIARRGIAALSIGFDPRVIDTEKSGLKLQPLSYLAYCASNARAAMATLPEIDPKRIGVMGHSYGGKWAMFAAALDEKFACGVWSDPGIMFDEPRSNVNYWEPWYLGWEPGVTRKPGLITADNPRTGAYKRLFETGHDLHEIQALVAPRPFLVSGGSEDSPERWNALRRVVEVNTLLGASHRVAMTNRPDHTPTEESNARIVEFLEYVLKPGTP